MRDVNVSGPNATVNINYPTQREFELETKSEMVSVRFYPKEIPILKAKADRAGLPLSKYLRKVVVQYTKAEASLLSAHKALEEIFE